MDLGKHDISSGRLRNLLDRKIKELGNRTVHGDGNIPVNELDSIERLKHLVDLLSYASPPRRKRWPMILLFGATLAILSLLLFARVRSTEIELNLTLSELGFSFPRQQALADVMQLSSIGVSGLQKIELPRTGDQDPRTLLRSAGSGSSVLLTTGDPDSTNRGTISLSTLNLMPGAHVWLRPADIPNQFRLSVKGRDWLIRLGVNGQIAAVLAGQPRTRLDLRIPGLITLQPDSDIVDMDIQVRNSAKKIFSDQMIVDSLSFFRIDEFVDPDHTLIRRASTILSGTLYFESLGGQERRLRPGEELDFEGSRGEIRTLELRDGHIGLAFHGRVRGMTSGVEDHRYNIMPTWLEWLKARHGLGLLWGTTLYVFGLIVGMMRWWKDKS
jgi:hypothetical protein